MGQLTPLAAGGLVIIMAGAQGMRDVVIVGGASSVGIRPYVGRNEARHLDEAAAVLRE